MIFIFFDSGGQYKFGTTDVTRTILNKETKIKGFNEISYNYTLVLKGHIAVASSHFKKGETGKNLDNKARKFLIKNGLNYDHGTGHIVGSYLGVHEGLKVYHRNHLFLFRGNDYIK